MSLGGVHSVSIKCSPRLGRCFAARREPRRAAGPLGWDLRLGGDISAAAGPSRIGRQKGAAEIPIPEA